MRDFLHHLHIRGDVHSESDPIHISGRLSQRLPVEGVSIFLFNYKSPYHLSHIQNWITLLHRSPLDWLQPSEEEWRINIDGAKEALLGNLAIGYSRPDNLVWPTWLHGTIQTTPGFEVPNEGQGYPHLSFYLTERVVTKAKTPSLTNDRPSNGATTMTSDTYHIYGQAGSVGPHSKSSNSSFVQVPPKLPDGTDLATLADELKTLLEVMRKDARETPDFQCLANISGAQEAASKGDSSITFDYLKAAGKWAFDVATKIGVGVAVNAIKHAQST